MADAIIGSLCRILELFWIVFNSVECWEFVTKLFFFHFTNQCMVNFHSFFASSLFLYIKSPLDFLNQKTWYLVIWNFVKQSTRASWRGWLAYASSATRQHCNQPNSQAVDAVENYSKIKYVNPCQKIFFHSSISNFKTFA